MAQDFPKFVPEEGKMSYPQARFLRALTGINVFNVENKPTYERASELIELAQTDPKKAANALRRLKGAKAQPVKELADDGEATFKQGMFLRKQTGLDVRQVNLTVGQAKHLIARIKDEKVPAATIASELLEMGCEETDSFRSKFA